jgi:hypothetical protein
MRTEHVSNLHPGWVIGGWLVALAATGLVFLALVGLGGSPDGIAVPTLALLVGFFAGGLFVGMAWSDAPVLHGVAITLLTVVVWFLGLLIAPESLPASDPGAEAAVVLGAVLLQLAAAVGGSLTGRALVLRGRTPDPAMLPPEA